MRVTGLPRLLVISVFAQIAIWITVLLNILVLRQVIGFVYLTFLPGFSLLSMLRYREMSLSEIILFSSGLSLAFLMFVGLVLNGVLPFFGLDEPLSTLALLATISIATFGLSCAATIIRKPGRLFVLSTSHGMITNPLTPLLVSLPVLSILATLVMKDTNNNVPLLLVLTFVAALIAMSALGCIPAPLYPLVIVSIAIALLFQTTLISNYISGFDIHLEYQLAEISLMSSRWDLSAVLSASGPALSGYALQYGDFDSMLSITILPVVYARILGTDILPIFTVIYPLLFSLVPVALYKIYNGVFDQRVAFLSVLFFMSFNTFYVGMAYLARQMIAELFFVLLFILAFERTANKGKLVMIFALSAALIVSHYSLSYIYVAYVVAIAFFSLRTRKMTELNITYLGLLLVMVFGWYFGASGSAVVSLSQTVSMVGGHIATDMFSFGARDPYVSRILILGPVSLQQRISRITFIATVVCVVVGYVKTVFIRKNMGFSTAYFVVSSISIALISLSVLLPYLGQALNLDRFYEISLLFAAPFPILGAEVLLARASTMVHSLFAPGWLRRRHARVSIRAILLASLLVLYFLSQVGYLYEVTGAAPISVSLTADKNRFIPGDIAAYGAVPLEQDVFGARWLSRYMVSWHGVSVFSDETSMKLVLTSQGMLNWGHMAVFYPSSIFPPGTYVFLSRLNVVNGVIVRSNHLDNVTELSGFRYSADKIYSNGGTEVGYCYQQPYCTENATSTPDLRPSGGVSATPGPEVRFQIVGSDSRVQRCPWAQICLSFIQESVPWGA